MREFVLLMERQGGNEGGSNHGGSDQSHAAIAPQRWSAFSVHFDFYLRGTQMDFLSLPTLASGQVRVCMVSRAMH